MGLLQDKVNDEMILNGNGIVDNFKNNSLFFYDKYQSSDKVVCNISVSDIEIGMFYFIHYMDDSNWMRLSPIFVADLKKFSNMIIIFAINFNFIPLQVRVTLFDKFMIDDNFENGVPLKVDYKGVYTELLRLGFEYALMEYNLLQVKIVHRISMSLIPRFLYSQHPVNIYDPTKLMQIWNAKISDKANRNNEIMKSLVNDFYEINGEIKDQYKLLKDHIQRIQKSLEKYGGK